MSKTKDWKRKEKSWLRGKTKLDGKNVSKMSGITIYVKVVK